MPKETLSKLLNTTIPLYQVGLIISVCPDAAREFHPKMDLDEGAMGAVFRVVQEDTGHFYLGVVFGCAEWADANTVAHEAVHVAWRCLQHAGVKASVNNQEPLAYLVGWIADEITKFVKPHQKAARRKKKC